MKSKMLPDAEYEIMNYVWDSVPPITTPMVMEALGKQKDWKIQTVAALFARLMERGFLRVEKGAARERAFYPIISRDEYLAMETESFITRYHKKSFTSLLSALHCTSMSQEDLDELSDWVKTLRKDEK